MLQPTSVEEEGEEEQDGPPQTYGAHGRKFLFGGGSKRKRAIQKSVVSARSPQLTDTQQRKLGTTQRVCLFVCFLSSPVLEGAERY